LCIGIETHREQYDAYHERKLILQNQKIIGDHLEMIEKRLDGVDAPEPPQRKPESPPIPNNNWNATNVPWGTLDEVLGRHPGGRGKEPEESEDGDDDDDDDGSEDGDDEEDSREE